ncbi:MAG: hypothetical protein AB7N73_15490 [Gemmatimonadales bacterium]
MIATPVFTRQATVLWPDADYAALQRFLVAHPEAGAVIPGSGGLRKVRWSQAGGGKRGGVRVIYRWFPARQRLYLLLAYRKREADTLTRAQLAILRRMIDDA